MTEEQADRIMTNIEYMTVWAMEDHWAPSARREDYIRMLEHLYDLHKLRDERLYRELVWEGGVFGWGHRIADMQTFGEG